LQYDPELAVGIVLALGSFLSFSVDTGSAGLRGSPTSSAGIFTGDAFSLTLLHRKGKSFSTLFANSLALAGQAVGAARAAQGLRVQVVAFLADIASLSGVTLKAVLDDAQVGTAIAIVVVEAVVTDSTALTSTSSVAVGIEFACSSDQLFSAIARQTNRRLVIDAGKARVLTLRNALSSGVSCKANSAVFAD